MTAAMNVRFKAAESLLVLAGEFHTETDNFHDVEDP
jgi:hypothetical protein